MSAAADTDAAVDAVVAVLGDLVTHVELRYGWGGALHVRVHIKLGRHEGREVAARVRTAVAGVVSGRHRVEFVWGAGR